AADFGDARETTGLVVVAILRADRGAAAEIGVVDGVGAREVIVAHADVVLNAIDQVADCLGQRAMVLRGCWLVRAVDLLAVRVVCSWWRGAMRKLTEGILTFVVRPASLAGAVDD